MSLSDHEMIGFTRKVNNFKYTPRKISCRDYRNYDPVKMQNELKAVDWNYLYQIEDVNKAWTYVQTILSSIFNSHAPVISKIVKGKPKRIYPCHNKSSTDSSTSFMINDVKTTSNNKIANGFCSYSYD